ncbi:hypothetical protein HNR12_003259 [Streptomonospora nanhaiensis]|uniref:HTH cro/C1-type domain-containing protein n=1 Tax=Streptomonospora nanhaiensis TaxID=1323731 RepID=A0A853BRK7_9ACTN|nr:hypothetical protein [Streptomonospora nanhaiensis]NYI96982.1 hypothetical protein [Streptomonospora nanhaiensis]
MTFVPRAALPDDVLRRPDVEDALEKRDFGRLFFLARQWAGISYSAIAESCEIKPERVGSLARGRGTITSYAKIQQIADGMRIPGRMLGLLPRHWEHGPTGRSTETLGAKASGTAFQSSAPSRAGVPEAINAPAVGDADGLLADLDRLERDYDVASSAVLLGEAGLVHGALRRSGSTHRFLRLRARSALLMGQLLWDASHRRDGHAATVFFHEAVLAAHEARDQATLAQARLRTSFIPLYSGRPRDALVEVKRAANAATGVPYVRALVSLHVSEAYARLGRRAEAEGHLVETDRIAE